jgi:hypothetical protein
MSLRKDQALQFSDIGCVQLLVICFRSINVLSSYQHQGWPYECPQLERCACVKEGNSRGRSSFLRYEKSYSTDLFF